MKQPTRPARILIVDDHEVVIEGINNAVSAKPGFEVIGEALDGLHAIEMVESLKPDIIVMDITMPGQNGVETTRQIKQRFPEIKVVIYSMYSDEEYLVELFKSGISGYILKQEPFSRLLSALDTVRDGGTCFNEDTQQKVAHYIETIEGSGEQQSGLSILSPREKEVFIRLADGDNIKRVAASLSISPKTVETHKYNIMTKLGIRTVTEMTKAAIRLNLISLDD